MKICLIAGEPSGDQLGADIISTIQGIDNTIEFIGIGGEQMMAEGLDSFFDISDIAVNGFVEVIRHIPTIKKRMRQTVTTITAQAPDIIVTIDAPGFCKPVAKKLKPLGIPLVHYVAPTVWAWKPWRAKKFADIFDHLLTLLPFEAPYFTKYGLDTTFVGHPVTGFVQPRIARQDEIILLPGSRMGEVEKLLPLFKLVMQRFPELKVTVPTVATVEKYVRHNTPDDWQIVTRQEARWHAYAKANYAIAASGTVALELACAKVPTLIAYKTNPVTAFLVRRLGVNLKYASLINIMADDIIQPEYIQESCTAQNIEKGLKALISAPHSQDKAFDIATNLTPPTLGTAGQVILELARKGG